MTAPHLAPYPEPFFTPDPRSAARSRIADFARWAARHQGGEGIQDPTDYRALYQWSVTDLEGFWARCGSTSTSTRRLSTNGCWPRRPCPAPTGSPEPPSTTPITRCATCSRTLPRSPPWTRAEPAMRSRAGSCALGSPPSLPACAAWASDRATGWWDICPTPPRDHCVPRHRESGRGVVGVWPGLRAQGRRRPFCPARTHGAHHGGRLPVQRHHTRPSDRLARTGPRPADAEGHGARGPRGPCLARGRGLGADGCLGGLGYRRRVPHHRPGAVRPPSVGRLLLRYHRRAQGHRPRARRGSARTPQDARPAKRSGHRGPPAVVHHHPLDDVEPGRLHPADRCHHLHLRRQPGTAGAPGHPVGAGGSPQGHPLRHQSPVPAGHGQAGHRTLRARPVGHPRHRLHRLRSARLRLPVGPRPRGRRRPVGLQQRRHGRRLGLRRQRHHDPRLGGELSAPAWAWRWPPTARRALLSSTRSANWS